MFNLFLCRTASATDVTYPNPQPQTKPLLFMLNIKFIILPITENEEGKHLNSFANVALTLWWNTWQEMQQQKGDNVSECDLFLFEHGRLSDNVQDYKWFPSKHKQYINDVHYVSFHLCTNIPPSILKSYPSEPLIHTTTNI